MNVMLVKPSFVVLTTPRCSTSKRSLLRGAYDGVRIRITQMPRLRSWPRPSSRAVGCWGTTICNGTSEPHCALLGIRTQTFSPLRSRFRMSCRGCPQMASRASAPKCLPPAKPLMRISKPCSRSGMSDGNTMLHGTPDLLQTQVGFGLVQPSPSMPENTGENLTPSVFWIPSKPPPPLAVEVSSAVAFGVVLG